MSQLSIKLNAFEGPLDLLIHLIEKNKVDIYDIPIVEITEQYIEYLKKLSEFDMELASEFLVMAATLMQIKSRLLLPKNADDDDDESDPRQLLVEMLVEYRKIKQIAADLMIMKQNADRFIHRKPMFEGVCESRLINYSPADLLKAFAGIAISVHYTSAVIMPQSFSVKDKMEEILHRLQKEGKGFALNDLVASGNKAEKVASFLGILELLKMGLIIIHQTERFAPIYIFSKHGELH